MREDTPLEDLEHVILCITWSVRDKNVLYRWDEYAKVSLAAVLTSVSFNYVSGCCTTCCVVLGSVCTEGVRVSRIRDCYRHAGYSERGDVIVHQDSKKLRKHGEEGHVFNLPE